MLCFRFCVLKLSKYTELNPFPFLPTSASMFVCHDFAFMLFLRVKTAQHCVLLVYTDRAACPPAPAIITHPALRSTAPASAERVTNIRSQLDFSFDCFWSVNSHSYMNKNSIYACIIWNMRYPMHKSPECFQLYKCISINLHDLSLYCRFQASRAVMVKINHFFVKSSLYHCRLARCGLLHPLFQWYMGSRL